MRNKSQNRLSGLITIVVIAFMLIGCNGKTGPTGTSGTNGTPGTNAGNAVDVRVLTPDQWAQLKPAGTVTSVTMGAAPVVNFMITDANGDGIKGLASFTAQSATATLPSYPNVSFALAKLVPEDPATKSPGKWVSYIVTTVPTYKSATDPTIVPVAPSKPTTDNTGTLVDHGDGSYTYTFYRDITKSKDVLAAAKATQIAPNDVADLGNVTYEPTLTHRLTIQISGNARGTGTNTPNAVQVVGGVPMLNPANVIYDFIPATGKVVGATDTQRQIVSIDSCNTCHAKLALHGGGRVDVQYCVVCHTDQRKYGNAEALTTDTGYTVNTTDNKGTYKINGKATGDMITLVHKLHMGEGLAKTGYNYAGILFNEVTYPQDERNCNKCHSSSDATPQGDNWNMKPSILACGSCHDDVNFATAANHPANVATTDGTCAGCHDPASIKAYHIPAVAPDPANGGLPAAQGGVASNTHTNTSWVAGNPKNLPAGASVVTWNLKSVSVNADQQPVFVFNFIKDGNPVVFNTYNATGKTELMDHFVGGPSLYMAFSLPQDGITAPADYNSTVNVNLRKLWLNNGTTAGATIGTLTGPDADGLYTATLTGVKVPTTASMITGGIGYFYGVAITTDSAAYNSAKPNATDTSSLPLTQINVPGPSWDPNRYAYDAASMQGGVSVPAPNAWAMAPKQTPRRAIVTTAKCNACHENLGTFRDSVFHAGQRNDAPTCTFCHTANGVDSGWGYNIKDVVHSLHASSKRTIPFAWQAGYEYWNVTYPGILNNCEACHVPGSYDLSNSASANAVPNLLWTTVASGNITIADTTQVLTMSNGTVTPLLDGNTAVSPFLLPGQVSTSYPVGTFAFGTGFASNNNLTDGTVTLADGTKPVLAAGTTYQAEGTTLVNSPVTSACYSCHDSSVDRSHMVSNGGSLNVPRSTVTTSVAGVNTVPINNNEQCLLCHASGKVADIKTVHMNFR